MYKQIHTKIWKQDDWFLDLEPAEKLLFIYLFSNELTTISGLYKIPLKVIIFETCLQEGFIVDTLAMFSECNKAHYVDGIMWVVNSRRYQASKSPKVQIKMDRELEDIPDNSPLKLEYYRRYGIDTLSIPKPVCGQEQEQKQEQKHKQEQEQKQDLSIPACLGDLVAYYENNSGLTVAEKAKADLLDLVDKRVPWSLLHDAERIATERGKVTADKSRWGYMMGIVKRTLDGTAPKKQVPTPTKFTGPTLEMC